MAIVTVAVDTSKNKTYSGIVSGLQTDIDNLHFNISKVLAKHGRRGTIHWQKLSKRIRKSAQKEVYALINSSRIRFYIFEHKKPRNNSKKDFYLNVVPTRISAYFDSWLRVRWGHAIIEVDDDYGVSKVKDSSLVFTEKFISRLSNRIAGTYVKVRNKKGILRTTVKNIKGSTLNLVGKVTNAGGSKGIQLADLILGYYFFAENGITQKITFIKI